MQAMETAHLLAPICNVFASFVGKELHRSLYIFLCLVVGLALCSSNKNDRVLCHEGIKSLLAEVHYNRPLLCWTTVGKRQKK